MPRKRIDLCSMRYLGIALVIMSYLIFVGFRALDVFLAFLVR